MRSILNSDLMISVPKMQLVYQT